MSPGHTEHEPFTARLSEYLDGELEPAARAELERHLGGCASCRRVLQELGELVTAARALPEHEPERDAWPAIAAALGPHRPRKRRRALALAFAAGALLTFALMRVFGARPEAQGRYLLLLHEPVGFRADEATRLEDVERYRSWLQSLGESGLGGEELEAGGTLFTPDGASAPLPGGARIGGYFLLAAPDEATASAMARTVPHLERGGQVELRRIRSE